MGTLSKYRVLVSGILSPFLAVFLNVIVNGILMRFSADPEKDWRFRLSISTVVMAAPVVVTLVLALKERRRTELSLSWKIGLAIALLSLGLVAKPVSDGMTRSKQEQNSMTRDVPAPLFDTPDLFGKPQRLTDYKGEVVLVNIWATWCAPCRAEMPALDRLFQARKDRGFVVLGMSDESVAAQRKFQDEVKVSYPLLTLTGDVPHFYRDIARYPAMFLIDRHGRLRSTPNPGQPFERVVASVDALLNEDPSQ
jgi:cytochrome c biogenesis protein CcmG, thiol:disulfide interchange protein DsbE